MRGDLTPGRFIIIIIIILIFVAALVSYYGGYFKDTITKTTCPLMGEEYEEGDSKGDGKCVVPVGTFD